MKPSRHLARIASVIALSAAAAAAAPPPGYVSLTLPNGLRVSILENAAMPVVATQVWYHVGSANEEPRTRGFAHLFEHLMFGGTAAHPKRAVWDHHERFGGDVNAYTTFDETVFVSAIPPAGHLPVLDLEADRMVNLSLDEENLANEKKIVTEELRVSTENEPWSRLLTEALKKVFGEHPYALSPVGTKEDIAAATLEHAREFYERYYRPRNAHLVVVGPVDAQAVLARVREVFGALPADGITPPDVPALDAWKYPDLLELRGDLPPAEIAVAGFPLPPPTHADDAALLLVGELLAGGSVDPFEDELVRKRNQAVYAQTEIETMRRGGLLLFIAASLPYRREKTAFRHLDEALGELGRFEWLDEERFAAAKKKLAREEQTRIYFADATATEIGSAAWWEGDETRAFDRAARIQGVSRADVEAAFRRYILEARPVRLYVRPEHVPFHVRLFGWLYPVFGGR
jgi:zinc protease